ncbi:hypothetical protein [Sorangium sp. So ce1099]|uniref:hypothetical protein n=1 Tax=Sorangium sp. So ce1099 TaxID=3133331 RepID=UPI003F623134
MKLKKFNQGLIGAPRGRTEPGDSGSIRDTGVVDDFISRSGCNSQPIPAKGGAFL